MLRLLSALLTLALLIVAVAFAVANGSEITLGLWPFETGVFVPVYVVGLGALFTGLVLGGFFSWLAMVPYCFEAGRLRRQLEKERAEAIAREQTEEIKPKPKFWRLFS